MPNKKVLGVVVLIAIVAIVGYFVWNSNSSTSQVDKLIVTDETQNWKTYTNTKHGYSFQYPNKLSLAQTDEEVRLFMDVPNLYNDFELSIKIVSGEAKPYYDQGTYSAGSLNGKLEAMGNDVSGITYYYFPISGNRTLVVARHEKFGEESSYNKEWKELQDQILSTFKFTK